MVGRTPRMKDQPLARAVSMQDSINRTHGDVHPCLQLGFTRDPSVRAHETVDALDCAAIVIGADDGCKDSLKVCTNMTPVV